MKNQFENETHKKKKLKTLKKYLSGIFGIKFDQTKGQLAIKDRKTFIKDAINNNDLTETYTKNTEINLI